jgi:quercetin dioxygenase-like cupin family protein
MEVSHSPSAAFAQFAAIPPQQIWEGVVVRALHGEQATLGLVELAPNSVVPEHTHPNEQMGVLVRGSFSRFRIAGESQEIRPGDTWRIPGGVPHEVETGPEGALVVELWSPPRRDWEEFEHMEPRPADWP